MEKQNVNVLSLMVFVTICTFTCLITIGLFRTTGKVFGMFFLGSALFVVAWMAEMLIPEKILVYGIMYVSGVGLFCTSLMTAIFPYIIVSALMISLLVLSWAQIILFPQPPPEDS